MASASVVPCELNTTIEENEIEQNEINAFVKAIPQVEVYFDVLGKTGDGTFSSVFVAQLKGNQQKEKYALKNIIPTSKADRVANELKCLKEIGGSNNVIGVKAVIRNGQRITIVMPYIEHEKFTDYFVDMTISEIKEYMRNLLLALKRVHEFDIIHRDIKPSNFLNNRQKRKYALVDFGLAHPAPKSHEALKRELGEEPSDTLKSIENWGKTPKQQKVATKKPWSPRRLTLVTNATKNSTRYDKCQCVGKPTVCSICLSRPRQQAPRAGTPGFRAPEVLLRHADQTTGL
ncbi:DgyrCDS623 [Dimorphilus gyrociliatus]|uniref:non-specific serine/threonine protein kinase n=1 Tax=Dimorphilus gyrociliatus TaxID=2664684 RepID=A0A7I8V6G7_9ANNE|nr:DgyrCDS623 [Dimorphilus gyrociliatus]